MTTRIKTILVATVALVAMGTIQTGENKNVATIFDFIGNLLDGGDGGLTSSFQEAGGTAQPTSVSGTYATSPVTAVQGASTSAGPVYYDSQSGQMVGENLPTGPSQQEIQRQQQQNAARGQFNQGRTNILGDITNAAGNFAQTGTNNILDFIEGLKSQQQGLDMRRTNAVLGQRNAAGGIRDMVGQGIRSFGVNLANRNAGDSSAALAGAQAYGRMGNQQMRGVNQQLGLENANIDVAQQGLNASRESGRRRFETEKSQKINDLTNYAQQQFATLNAQAEGAGIMDRIAIEQEKENIKNQLIQQLSVLDAELGKANTINPMDEMGIQQKAGELSQLGQGGTQFDFSGSTPTQLQTGSQLSQLPIFSNRRRRE